jgi:hypothetical protein
MPLRAAQAGGSKGGMPSLDSHDAHCANIFLCSCGFCLAQLQMALQST